MAQGQERPAQRARIVAEPQERPARRMRLALRTPFAAGALLAYLAARAVPGVERVEGRTYVRTLRLPHAPGVVAAELHDDRVEATLRPEDPRDEEAAVAGLRRLLDLDADPAAVDAALGADPVLAPLVRATPGLRAPGAFDGAEIAVRAVVGQQISVAAARTVLGRLAERFGEPADGDGLTRRFPTTRALAAADPEDLPMPRRRGRCLVGLCAALADGEAALGPDLTRLPGIGPWTAGYVALRALGDPDVLMTGDLALRRAAARAGLPDDPGALAQRAEAWRPWRSYATHHLWRSLTA